MKTIYILAGGGSRGAFQLGALSVMLRLFPADIYVAQSIGALIAAGLKADLSCSELHQIARKARIWNVRRTLNRFLAQYITEKAPDIFIQTTSLALGDRQLIQSGKCVGLGDYHNLLRATSAQPLLSGSYTVAHTRGESHCLADGGAKDSIPAQLALNELGDTLRQSRVIIIGTRPDIPIAIPRTRLAQQLRLWEIGRKGKASDDLVNLLRIPAELIYIRPEQTLPPTWWNSTRTADAAYQQGREAVQKYYHA